MSKSVSRLTETTAANLERIHYYLPLKPSIPPLPSSYLCGFPPPAWWRPFDLLLSTYLAIKTPFPMSNEASEVLRNFQPKMRIVVSKRIILSLQRRYINGHDYIHAYIYLHKCRLTYLHAHIHTVMHTFIPSVHANIMYVHTYIYSVHTYITLIHLLICFRFV